MDFVEPNDSLPSWPLSNLRKLSRDELVYRLINFAIVAFSAIFIFKLLSPSKIFSDTTATGGDMGAHIWQPMYIRDHVLSHFRLSWWTPDYYAGMPAGQFYFPLPTLMIIGLDLILPYNIAFKFITVLGLVLFPIAAYVLGRGMQVRRPGPAMMAVATLPFLFDRGWTIYGSNIFSAMAGMYSNSWSLTFAFFFLGTYAYALRTGKRVILAALLFTASTMSHVVPVYFVLVPGAILVTLIYMFDVRRGKADSETGAAGAAKAYIARSRLRVVAVVGIIGSALSACFVLPFITSTQWLTDMGWETLPDGSRIGGSQTVKTLWDYLAPANFIPTSSMPGNEGHSKAWVLFLAVLGSIALISFARRIGFFAVSMWFLSGFLFATISGYRIWNARILPFWFMWAYILAALFLSELSRGLARIYRYLVKVSVGSVWLAPTTLLSGGFFLFLGHYMFNAQLLDVNGQQTEISRNYAVLVEQLMGNPLYFAAAFSVLAMILVFTNTEMSLATMFARLVPILGVLFVILLGTSSWVSHFDNPSYVPENARRVPLSSTSMQDFFTGFGGVLTFVGATMALFGLAIVIGAQSHASRQYAKFMGEAEAESDSDGAASAVSTASKANASSTSNAANTYSSTSPTNMTTAVDVANQIEDSEAVNGVHSRDIDVLAVKEVQDNLNAKSSLPSLSLPTGNVFARAIPTLGAVVFLASILVNVGMPNGVFGNVCKTENCTGQDAQNGAVVSERSWLPFRTDDESGVRGWARWNFAGYEADNKAYSEFYSLMTRMGDLGRQYGCGRATWDYEEGYNRFGTTLALMTLPHWTDGCITSMEGIYFESSATTPYHFENTSLIGRTPSAPMRFMEYEPYDLAVGIERLQLMGVKYYMTLDPVVQADAEDVPDLELISTGPSAPRGKDGADRVWKVYEVKNSNLVEPLEFEPKVIRGVSDVNSDENWLSITLPWYRLHENRETYLASDGPSAWQSFEPIGDVRDTELCLRYEEALRMAKLEYRTTDDWLNLKYPQLSQDSQERQRCDDALHRNDPKIIEQLENMQSKAIDTKVTVSQLVEKSDEVSFRVDSVGQPILIKISYFPNWKVKGAEGPYRISPNFMVVVPKSNDVRLYYSWTTTEILAYTITGFGFAAMLWLLIRRRFLHKTQQLLAGTYVSEEVDISRFVGKGQDEPSGTNQDLEVSSKLVSNGDGQGGIVSTSSAPNPGGLVGDNTRAEGSEDLDAPPAVVYRDRTEDPSDSNKATKDVEIGQVAPNREDGAGSPATQDD